MAQLYQKRDLIADRNVGEPGPLPTDLQGLSDDDLANLSWTDGSLGYTGFGFFPVTVYNFAADRAARRQAADVQFMVRFGQGFNVVIEGVAENLQMRPTDLVNWLTFKDACDDAIDAGFGDYEAEMPVRCTSNREYVLTNDQGRALMIALRSYGASLMKNKWRIFKAYDAATTKAQLDAVDVSWPSNTGWVLNV